MRWLLSRTRKKVSTSGKFSLPKGVIYHQNYISSAQKTEILNYLSSIYPLWENRYSKSNPPPEGQTQRRLLRPVYWLGNWQFACLDYYHPPKGIHHRCVEAESFPPILQKIVQQIQDIVTNQFQPSDIPRGWHLNTCLINFYGDLFDGNKWLDHARVGEHKDFEPGPVASISFGERALFQFVSSRSSAHRSDVVFQQWLEDSSLQIFGGDRFKKNLFHRVQRVERKLKSQFDLRLNHFETRRINFTFRYVPNEHIVPFTKLPENLREDVLPYMMTLSENSPFFSRQIDSLK